MWYGHCTVGPSLAQCGVPPFIFNSVSKSTMYVAFAVVSYFVLWGLAWWIATIICRKNGALQPVALGFLVVLLPMSVVFSVGMYEWKLRMQGLEPPVAQVPLKALMSMGKS